MRRLLSQASITYTVLTLTAPVEKVSLKLMELGTDNNGALYILVDAEESETLDNCLGFAVFGLLERISPPIIGQQIAYRVMPISSSALPIAERAATAMLKGLIG